MKYHSFINLKLVLLKLIQNSIGCRKSAETQKTNFSRNKLDDNPKLAGCTKIFYKSNYSLY